ncbi:MAG TPA: radical SAM protein [Rhodocyclaceae bacterium]
MKKPRILVVNCFSDNHRGARGNPLFVPQPMIAAVLAGIVQREKAEVRAWCEFSQGPLEDLRLLGWPDLLVLTGLNAAFDRMKQVAAYARTLNPQVVVAMGGSAARALPLLSRRYFDYVCTGDVEQLVDVLDDTFGAGLAAERPLPRYDLTKWLGWISFAESSRNCNFRCNFCSMTAEDRDHVAYDLDYVRRQIEAMGYRHCVMFLDQNFFAGSRSFLRARLELLRQLRREGRFGGWSALVTSDFYTDPENLRLARESGCIGFFCGVESFSRDQIAAYKKKQNLILPQEQMIAGSIEAGLVFHYGMMFDPTDRSVDDLQEEIDFIAGNPKITLPSFLSFAIPLIGTPLFADRLTEGSLLPDLKLRDMDGRSIVCHTRDPLDKVVDFARRMDGGLMPRRKVAAHAWNFYRRYRGRMSFLGMGSAMVDAWAMAFPALGTNGRDRRVVDASTCRSYVASTEKAGSLYRPKIRVADRYRANFAPLFVTDADGGLAEDVIDDLAPRLVRARPAADSLFEGAAQ